jgi:hypothetical protein
METIAIRKQCLKPGGGYRNTQVVDDLLLENNHNQAGNAFK